MNFDQAHRVIEQLKNSNLDSTTAKACKGRYNVLVGFGFAFITITREPTDDEILALVYMGGATG